MSSSSDEYDCNNCGREFDRTSQFIMHRISDDCEKKFKCTICKRKCSYEKNLLTHLGDHERQQLKRKKATCFSKEPMIRKKVQDLKKVSLENLLPDTTGCHESKQLEDVIQWTPKDHENGKHLVQNELQMQMKEVVVTVERLETSSRQHFLLEAGYAKCNVNVAKSRKYTCEICFKKFQSNSKLERHLRTHTKIKVHSCDTCGKSFAEKYNLTVHIKKLHSGKQEWPCEVCGKNFNRSVSLKNHERLHKRITANSSRLDNGNQIQQVPNYVSEKQRSITGKLDNDYTDVTSFITLHTASNGLKRIFKCMTCGKDFKHKNSLDKHLTGHRRPAFKCKVCKQKFTRKDSAVLHLKRHYQVRPFPFKCYMCEKTFRNTSDRKLHQAVHSEERPFACHTCGKAFKWKVSLKGHLVSHSRDISKQGY